jgi:hypothetical protein
MQLNRRTHCTNASIAFELSSQTIAAALRKERSYAK